jgi:hypothetical protein
MRSYKPGRRGPGQRTYSPSAGKMVRIAPSAKPSPSGSFCSTTIDKLAGPKPPKKQPLPSN